MVWTKRICRKWNALVRTWPVQIKSMKTVETLLNCKPRKEEMRDSAERRSFEADEKLNVYKINKKMKAPMNPMNQNMTMKRVLRVMLVVYHGTFMMARLTLKKVLK